MIPEKVIKKIDKQWAASKAIIFDWKGASDEEVAYMMSLYLLDVDKVQHDPVDLLKIIKALRHGKFTVPKYKISPGLRTWIHSETVNGKQFRLGWDLALEHDGVRYDILKSNMIFMGLAEFGYKSYNAASAFERASLIQFLERNKEYTALLEKAREEAPELIKAYAEKARPAKKVHKKTTERLMKVITDNFSPQNLNLVEMFIGIIVLMKDRRYESEIEGFLTGLRRNVDSVNSVTPEILEELHDLLTVKSVSEG